MSPLQIVLVAMRALLRNKMRSFLTALGVVIGVGAVVAMSSIGAGARARVEQTFSSMGSHLLWIRSASNQTGGAHGGAGTQPTLTWKDLDAIRTDVSGVAAASPVVAAPAQVMAEGQNWATSVRGTSAEFFAMRAWQIARGSFFTDEDVSRGAKVAVVGQTVVEKLFGPWSDPVGQILRVQNVPFEIVGVTAEKGPSPWGGDQDDVVFVPVTTFRARVQGGLSQFIDGNILVAASVGTETGELKTRLEALLRERHRLSPPAPDDFFIRNLGDVVRAREEAARTLTSLLAGIALVSLVVGGIGIMNIMLVSVTERTREIGLRMAVGAKPRNVLVQFLVEAISLSLIGGFLGVLAGIGAALWLTERFDWPMLVQLELVALALASSAIVGVTFGVYPAYRASRLDPIQALHYE